MSSNKLKQELLQLAKEMRSNPTPAEKLLWERLRNRQLDGFKFRRQHVIDRFIVDFCCLKYKLVVEVDGPIHRFSAGYDFARSQKLGELGFHEIRFFDDQVLNDIDRVKERILEFLQRVKSD